MLVYVRVYLVLGLKVSEKDTNHEKTSQVHPGSKFVLCN